ncbi:MAG: hypothetical protein ACRC9L_08090 [Brevinema sp.]
MSKNFLDFRFFGLLSLMFVTGCNLSSLAAINDTTDTQDTITPDVSQPSTDSRFDLSTDEGVFRHRVAGRTITIVDSAGKQSSITFSDDASELLTNGRTLTIDNVGSVAWNTVGVRDPNYPVVGGLEANAPIASPITASAATYGAVTVDVDSSGVPEFTYQYNRRFTLNLGSRSGTIKTKVIVNHVQAPTVTVRTNDYTAIFDMD